MRPQGSPAELERRRLRAIELLKEGLEVHQVASQLGVDRRSVRRWKGAHRRKGKKGVLARIATGRPPKLTGVQRRSLVRMILKGPEAFGVRNALWTCPRIVQLIEKSFHVSYHPDHVGRLLHSCGLTPQRPQTVAKERDERRIGTWLREDWPRIKKTRKHKGTADLPR